MLAAIRREKTNAKLSMRSAVDRAQVSGESAAVSAAREAAGDIAQAGVVAELDWTESEGPLVVRAELAAAEAG